MRHPSFAAFAHQRHGGALVLAGVIFAFGVTVGAMVRPSSLPENVPSFDTARAAAAASGAEPAALVGTNSHKFDLQTVYPAEVVRVIDGDTFQARVQVWPGLSVDTRVRLRGIDAPELHARCADEYAKAQAARAALETMLAAGGVTISRVGIDKYGGRVDASVATRDTADVSGIRQQTQGEFAT
jgi:endonuclease YncB( thermonuclease family)